MPVTLDRLEQGQSGIVTDLTCTGSNRRRMMDLGILPGTSLTVEFTSPLGDPTAYRVRESLIALRRAQAKEIEIEPIVTEASDHALSNNALTETELRETERS
ncbi:MAG: ferrous iron transport protein A [Anaerolineae bacterium]|nr:ferrous iron transport protein A [Anaerolineae bacterium]